jgi:hypothetical protein
VADRRSRLPAALLMVTRSDWKDITETIGILAIVVSLILVAIELKQNTEMTRAQITQSRAETAIGLANMTINSDYVPGILVEIRAGEELTPEEVIRYQFWFRASLGNLDNNLQQYELGLLDAHIPRATERAARNIILTGTLGPGLWHETKDNYSDSFVAFVEEKIAGLGTR